MDVSTSVGGVIKSFFMKKLVRRPTIFIYKYLQNWIGLKIVQKNNIVFELDFAQFTFKCK